jgi:hypothetical protein
MIGAGGLFRVSQGTHTLLAVVGLLTCGCAKYGLVTDIDCPARGSPVVPERQAIESSHFSRRIEAPVDTVWTHMLRTLALSAPILAAPGDRVLVIADVGSLSREEGPAFAEFPMALELVAADSVATVLYVLPLGYAVMNDRYRKAYRVAQGYYAQKVMYRVSVEVEGGRRWPWLFGVGSAR